MSTGRSTKVRRLPPSLARAGLAIASTIAMTSTVRFLASPAEARPLELSSYRMTFDESFDTLNVSPWGPGTRWIAHTPWNGDFGDAVFIDPKPGAPFTIDRGMLTITMTKDKGRWQSGLLASVDRDMRGFLQSGGYFEIRAKLPAGAGVWPAFWLASPEAPDKAHPEIDVFEYYGHDAGAYMATVHLWRNGKSEHGEAVKIRVPPRSLEAGFHLYGVLIDTDYVTFYLDRKEVGRLPSRPEYLQPCYVMVDLGAGGGWPIDGIADPSKMQVDYIRAYSPSPAASAR